MSVEINMTAKQDDNGRLWNSTQKFWWLTALWSGGLLLYACRMSTPLCVAHMSHDFGWDKETEGLILSLFFVGYSTSQVFGGLLSDMYGGAVVLYYATLGWSTLVLVTPIVIHWYLPLLGPLAAVYLARVGSGIFQGFHFPSQSSLMVHTVTQKERAFTYSFISTGGAVGNILIGIVGSMIITAFGWPLVFYIFGGLSILWALVLRWSSHSEGKDHDVHSENGIIIQGENSWKGFRRAVKLQFWSVPWSVLVAHPAFWALLATGFCDGMGAGIAWSWSPTYFHEEFPEGTSWVYNSAPWFLRVIFNLLGGVLGDGLIKRGVSVTTSRKIVSSLSLGGSGICLFLLMAVKSYYPALIYMSLAIGVTGFYTSGIPIVPQDITPKYAGIIYGILNSTGSVSNILGAYIPGLILAHWKSWPVVFFTAGVVNCLGAVIFVLLGSSEKIV